METLDRSVARARPPIGPDEAALIAEAHWGLSGAARELPSERDRVFVIDSPRNGRAVLKVANGLESADALELQRRMLERLAAAELPYAFPRPLPSSGGEPVVWLELDSGRHATRMLTHVGGRPLMGFSPRTDALERQIGHLAGCLDRVLADLTEAAPERNLVWDPRRAPDIVRGNLAAAGDGDRRTALEACLEGFAGTVAPRAEDLPLRLIHNDVNDANLRIDPGGFDEPPHLLGLVDFGDALRTWRANDLATACAYACLDRPDPLRSCVNVARGYATVLTLEEVEADVLLELVRLRLALSVVISAVRADHESDNAYLRVSRDAACRTLERLGGIRPDFGRYRLRAALGYEACPRGARVAAALERLREGASPILEPDPRRVPPLAIDLSVEVGDDGGRFDPEDQGPFAAYVEERLRQAGAEVGVGRYDEARFWYASDDFRHAGNGRDEWRTIHLGVDLFAAPGTPVLAPLAGRVAAVAEHPARLDYGPALLLEHEAEDEEGPVRFWTLYGHLGPEVLERLAPDAQIRAGGRIGEIGAPPRNGGWAPHLHFQVIADRLGHADTFPGVATPAERDVWISICPDPGLLLGLPLPTSAPRPPTTEALRERRARLIGPSLSLSYRRPLHIVRGRGTRLYDADGQPYLDVVNNVAHVGHCHPRISEAARDQMARLNTNTRYLHQRILEYAERLVATFPDPLSVCYFVCSGTEASELALRMARTHTRKTGAVVVEGAYHGNSSSVVNLSPYKFDGPGGKGVRPWVRVVPIPDAYRGRYRGEDTGPRYAAHVANALESLASEPGPWGGPPPGAAAFFCESILSCGGQIPLPPGYLAAATRAAREAGAVYVADEVQVGFGRVGSHFWAFEEHGVVPDIVTLGKPMGNGHPLAAVVTTPEIAASFDTGMEFFSTFGGNPVSCAVGLAVLDVLRDEGLQGHALRVGTRLLEGLRELMGEHSWIGDVRGRGLFLGIELVRDREERIPAPDAASYLVERMRERGVLLSTDGPARNVIKMKPPMVFSEEDAEWLLSGLDSALTETPFRDSASSRS